MWKNVQVMGHEFKIQLVPNLEDAGETDLHTRTISIRSELSLEEQWLTLFHELCHAALGTGGVAYALNNEGLEEGVVRALEHGVWPVLPLLIQDMTRAPRSRRTRSKKCITPEA